MFEAQQQKTILITGGAGFIGHHVVEGVLKNTDWHIVLLDCINYAGNLNRLPDIDIFTKEQQRIKFVWHDLKSEISEETHKKIGSVQYIWHLAAESDVQRSLENSIPFLMSNVVGTGNLLEYIKKYQNEVEKIIVFSTDEVLGPAPKGIYYQELDVLNPSNPYAASKEGEEAIAKAFAFSFGLPITITRTMNVMGERQNYEKFIPKTLKAVLMSKKITLHGTPEIGFSSRCWIHARAVASALLFLSLNAKLEIMGKQHQNEKGYGIYHIVGEERDVLYLANKISEIVKGRKLNSEELEFVNFHQTRPGHDFRYAMSGEKLKILGWENELLFDESFAKMIHWMAEPKHKNWLGL